MIGAALFKKAIDTSLAKKLVDTIADVVAEALMATRGSLLSRWKWQPDALEIRTTRQSCASIRSSGMEMAAGRLGDPDKDHHVSASTAS